MSGGHWNYQSHDISDFAGKVAVFLEAVAESERLIDWAISGDTAKEEEMLKLWDLWEDAFDKVYGS